MDFVSAEKCTTRQPALIFSNVVAERHFFFFGGGEGTPPRGLWPQIPAWLRFLYSAPAPKFHHLMFTRSEVIVSTNKHTNKQTPLKTFYFACNHGSDTTGRRKTAVADCEVLGIGEWPQQKLLLIGDLKHNQIKWTDLQAGAKINNARWALITKIT